MLGIGGVITIAATTYPLPQAVASQAANRPASYDTPKFYLKASLSARGCLRFRAQLQSHWLLYPFNGGRPSRSNIGCIIYLIMTWDLTQHHDGKRPLQYLVVYTSIKLPHLPTSKVITVISINLYYDFTTVQSATTQAARSSRRVPSLIEKGQ